MRGRETFARDRLEVEDVQRLAGGVDDRVEALARLPGRGGHGSRQQQRTSRQELEQPATVILSRLQRILPADGWGAAGESIRTAEV